MQLALLAVVILKSLAELSAMFIFGQGILYLLAAKNRETNLFYGLFRIITRPLYAAARAITPRAVVDRHIPYVALILIFWIWVFATYMKIDLCTSGKVQCEEMTPAERRE
jgi:hypothetical protein